MSTVCDAQSHGIFISLIDQFEEPIRLRIIVVTIDCTVALSNFGKGKNSLQRRLSHACYLVSKLCDPLTLHET